MKTKETHISLIKQGDTIKSPCGLVRTVCKSDIKKGFFGVSIFGDSYRMGTLKVEKITSLN